MTLDLAHQLDWKANGLEEYEFQHERAADDKS